MQDDPRWDRNWRRIEAMARQGFRRFGNFNINIDPGNWGGNFRIGRMLASGDLRLVALYLIEQQPRHGYDLIKAIEDRSAGFYSPSPGIVYPALTFLEEAGYVTSASEGNKRLYTITDEGRAHLADNREAIESTLSFLGKAGERMNQWRDQMSGEHGPFGAPFEEPREAPKSPGGAPPRSEQPDRDIGNVPEEVNEARKALKRAIKDAIAHGAAEQHRVANILRRAADEIRHGGRDEDIDL